MCIESSSNVWCASVYCKGGIDDFYGTLNNPAPHFFQTYAYTMDKNVYHYALPAMVSDREKKLTQSWVSTLLILHYNAMLKGSGEGRKAEKFKLFISSFAFSL